MLYCLGKFLSFLLCSIVLRMKVCGQENIPKKGGFILASNHASYLDPLAVGVACPRNLNYMARHDLFRNPFFGWILSQVGAFPVKRNSADISALKEAMGRVKAGKGLLLFPEGSRSVDGNLSEAQAGIGFLAAKLEVPVIPTVVKGTGKALSKGDKFIRPTKISVCFGKEILIERSMPYKDIAQEIMNGIGRLNKNP